MNSSGIKRGLAVSAVSAMAVAGLPFLASTASAVPATDNYTAEEVQLLSQFSGRASTKNDGQNTTVRLEAGAGTGVSSVTFQYNTGNPNTWVTIATVTRNDDGAFSYEWDASGLNGATVDLRAFETGTDPLVTADARPGVIITGSGVATESVNLNDASALGAFQAPYTDGYTGPDASVILSGTSSAQTGTVDLVHFFGNDDGAPAGTATLDKGVFSGVADITGYDFTGSPDELSFGAQLNSDDVETYTLYQQTIGAVTATPNNVNQPSGDPTATITITVTDQSGAPIANAEVRQQDGTLVGYTNASGQVVAEQGSGTKYYYANQTDSNPYEPSVGDKRSEDVTVTPYTPAPTSLAGQSNDGAAFDFDEYSAGDITVQIKDQQGNATDGNGQTLNYYWVVTPFDGSASQRFPATGSDSATDLDDDGKYVVNFPSGGKEGTYELYASLSEVPIQGGGAIAESKVLTVKAGESQVSYDEASPEVAPAGTTEPVSGKLVLDDGTGLAGRGLDFNYNTTGGNATIQESQGTANDGIITTAADGSFSFNVVDPAVAAPATQPTERGTLSVDPVNATNDSDNVGTDVGPDTQEVVFASAGAPTGSVITIAPDTDAQRPGETQDVTVTVDSDPNTAGVQPVANTTVTLTVDEGFFTNEAGTTNLGQSITVVTDSTGVATADIGIGRNAGFDDNGDVTSTVTASSGAAKSDTEDYDWTTDGTTEGTVDLVFSNDQTVTVLPKAPFETEVVYFDVFAYDKFGNPIDGVAVTLDGDFVEDNTLVTDLKNDQDTYAYQNSAGSEEYTVTWANAVDHPAPAPNTDATDSETIDWYAINVASATLTSTGTDPHAVGSTVTMTYKAVDQNGEPIDGYTVEFYRSGPDSTHDGNLETTKMTNAKGEAYYVFQGEVAGTANVTTVLYDTNGDIVPEGQAEATVTFGGKTNAGLTLRGGDNGAADDSLLANAINKTEGATVKLFRKRADGSWKLIRKGVMNAKGNYRFEDVNDLNGNKVTRYKAVVKATALTNRGVGKKKVR